MAVMSKMQHITPYVLWLLVLCFVGLIVFEWGMDYLGMSSGARSSVAGKVNGKSISREEYNQFYKRLMDDYHQRNNNADVSPAIEEMIKDQAFDQLVNRILVTETIEKSGLSVTDQEIYDWIVSDNPPTVIRQNFADPKTGLINRPALDQALNEPKNREVWSQVDRMVRDEKLSMKLQNLLSNFVTVSISEAKEKYYEDNTHLKADFLFFNPDQVTDSLIQVSDNDIKSYYNDHKKDYKQKELRGFSYVEFSKVPTKEDTVNTIADIAAITDEFKTAADDSLFVVTKRSERPYTSAWFSRGELSDPKEVAFDMAKGAVLQVKDKDGFSIIKVQDVREGTETFYRARHILIKPTGNTNADTAAAKALIEGYKKEIVAKKDLESAFIDVAQKYSQDGSAYKGGDLGWFKDGAMVKPFETAVKSGKVNTVIGPVKTQYGWHLIYLTGKDKKQVKVTEVFKTIQPGSNTLKIAQRTADDFAYMANKDGFEKEAQNRNLKTQTANPIDKRGMAAGLPQSSSLNEWLFHASEGQVSQVLDLNDRFIVAKLTSVSPEGFKPLDDALKSTLKVKVIREKKMDYLLNEAKKLSKEIGSNLVAASAKNSNWVVKTTDNFAISGNPVGVGRDLIFVGETAKLEKGATSEPFKGTRGVYIVQLKEKIEADMNGFDAKKDELMRTIGANKKSEVLNGLIEALKAKADVEDLRDVY